MTVYIKLDLSKYCLETIKVLYKDGILTREEFHSELMKRGCDEYIALQICRHIEGLRAS